MTEKIYLNRVAFGNLICYTIKIQAKEFINMRQGILKYNLIMGTKTNVLKERAWFLYPI